MKKEATAERSKRFKAEVSDLEKSDTLGLEISVVVVARRCVYVNDHRIAGGKPYMSENLPQHDFTTTLGQVFNAFSDEQILSAISERQHNRALVKKWRAENCPTKEQAND